MHRGRRDRQRIYIFMPGSVKLSGQQDRKTVVKLSEYKILMEKLAPYWDKLTLEKKKALALALVKKVTLDSLAPHFLHFTIEWDNPTWGVDKGLIWRKQGTAPEWSEEEKEMMRLHWAIAERDELMRLLPQRSWTSMQIMAQDLHVTREVKSKPNGIPFMLSLLDWQLIQEREIAL